MVNAGYARLFHWTIDATLLTDDCGWFLVRRKIVSFFNLQTNYCFLKIVILPDYINY